MIWRLTAKSQPNHSQITAKSQPKHSQITAKSQPNHSHSQPNRSQVTAKSQRNHSQITAKSQPNHRGGRRGPGSAGRRAGGSRTQPQGNTGVPALSRLPAWLHTCSSTAHGSKAPKTSRDLRSLRSLRSGVVHLHGSSRLHPLPRFAPPPRLLRSGRIRRAGPYLPCDFAVIWLCEVGCEAEWYE